MADETIYNDNLTLDEIVFQNRNKEYGAYDLRTKYPRILTKSFIVGTLLFLVLALSPFIYMKIQQMNAKDKVEVDSKLVNVLQEDKIIEVPKEKEPPPPPPPPKDPPKQEVIQNVVPEPKQAPKIETPPPSIEKQLETTTGLNSQEGVKTPVYTPPPPPPSSGKSNTVEVKAVNTNEVYETVDQASEFPGGINAFRSKVSGGFDTSVMSGDEGAVKTEVTFVVERDGSITDVKANGPNSDFNSEAVRTIKGIRNKWTPAKINGQAVRSRYRLPLTMQFAF
jgi:protein TonB